MRTESGMRKKRSEGEAKLEPQEGGEERRGGVSRLWPDRGGFYDEANA